MAYYEKSSSKDLGRLIAVLALFFVAAGSFGYLISRFGVNPMSVRNSVTLEQILNPNAEVELNKPEKETGQVAGEQDEVVLPRFPVKNIDLASVVESPTTVSTARINNIPFIRFNTNIIAPQSGFSIEEIDFSDSGLYPWKPLFRVESEESTVFSYMASGDTANSIIIVKSGTQYAVYVYNEFDKEHQVKLVNTFSESQSQIPYATAISPEGRYISLSLLRCATCTDEVPAMVMIDSQDGFYQSLGKTSAIQWGIFGQYQYKEYEETECPEDSKATKCTIDPQYLEFKSGRL